jgi:hypothetical protein
MRIAKRYLPREPPSSSLSSTLVATARGAAHRSTATVGTATGQGSLAARSPPAKDACTICAPRGRRFTTACRCDARVAKGLMAVAETVRRVTTCRAVSMTSLTSRSVCEQSFRGPEHGRARARFFGATLGRNHSKPTRCASFDSILSWQLPRAPHAEDGLHTSEHRHRDINDRGCDATDGPSRRCCALVAVVRSRKAAPRIIIAPTSLAGTARYLVVVTCTEQAATTITLYVLRANTIILCVLWIRVLFFWRSRNCAGLKAQGACHRCAPVRAAADGAKPPV